MDDDYLVSVICTTFNHEKYIRKCLDSLVNQKTRFKYEIIVHDDASTDGTQEILLEYAEKYPDLFVLILQKENIFSQGINRWSEYVYPMIRGKYVAQCEGDDFWTDEGKLQIQADFLNNNSEYVLCGHSAYYANEDGTLQNDAYFNYGFGDREITTEDIISDWKMATNSMMYLKTARGKDIIPYRGNAQNGDFCDMTYLSLHGKVYFIDRLMSAYRSVSIGSISWNNNHNPQRNIESNIRFIELLNRFDNYTEKKYTDAINKKIGDTKFTIALISGDLKEIKKHSYEYKKLQKKDRLRLYAKFFSRRRYRISERYKTAIGE